MAQQTGLPFAPLEVPPKPTGKVGGRRVPKPKPTLDDLFCKMPKPHLRMIREVLAESMKIRRI